MPLPAGSVIRFQSTAASAGSLSTASVPTVCSSTTPALSVTSLKDNAGTPFISIASIDGSTVRKIRIACSAQPLGIQYDTYLYMCLFSDYNSKWNSKNNYWNGTTLSWNKKISLLLSWMNWHRATSFFRLFTTTTPKQSISPSPTSSPKINMKSCKTTNIFSSASGNSAGKNSIPNATPRRKKRTIFHWLRP